MKLVIAEKPSVAMALANVIGARSRQEGYVEGSNYLVSWCVGHLVGLCDAYEYDERYKSWRYDDLPIVPEEWKTKILDATAKQFKVLKELMHRKDVTEIICATDAGREGELIFRLVYEQAGCRKPVKRLWISSMEETSIKEGFENLKDGSYYDDLYQSALCRARADWLVGINASRLFSVLYKKNLKVGRVVTPTLAMIVERNQKITEFKKEEYFETALSFGNVKAVSEKIVDREQAENLAARCRGKNCQMILDEKKVKTVPTPKLYDLTTLQRDANRILGYTAQETLEAAQSLYEEGLITYPRTDSEFLTDDMDVTEEELIELVEELIDFMDLSDYEPDIRKTLNSKKVTDHHAIIPTEKLTADKIRRLKEKPRNVLILIETRLLMATSKPYIYEGHTCELLCEGARFYLNFRDIIQSGFKSIERQMYLYFGHKNPEEEEPEIHLVLNMSYGPCDTEVLEKWTQPPRQFTEDSLLAAMERAGNEELTEETEKKGLGTPATRAAIIEKLVSSGFVTRKNKNLIPTNDGNVLITILPDEIKSPKMTANWEMQLNQIARGELSGEDFLNDITGLIREVTERYSGISENAADRFSSDQKKESLGACPRCGSPVYESPKNFYCSDKSCLFALWKNDRFFESQGKKLDKSAAKKLLSKGRVHYKDLRSRKTGKTYEGTIVMHDTGEGYVQYSIEFPQR